MHYVNINKAASSKTDQPPLNAKRAANVVSCLALYTEHSDRLVCSFAAPSRALGGRPAFTQRCNKLTQGRASGTSPQSNLCASTRAREAKGHEPAIYMASIRNFVKLC